MSLQRAIAVLNARRRRQGRSDQRIEHRPERHQGRKFLAPRATTTLVPSPRAPPPLLSARTPSEFPSLD